MISYFVGILLLLPIFARLRMEMLLDVLDSTGSTTLATVQRLQSRCLILAQLSVMTAARLTLDIVLDVLPVQTGKHLVLVLALKDEVALSTIVTLDIQLSLEEVKHMSLVTPNGRTDLIEVEPTGLCADGLGHDLDGLLRLATVLSILVLVVHDLLNAVQQEHVLIVRMSFHLVEIKLLCKTVVKHMQLDSVIHRQTRQVKSV